MVPVRPVLLDSRSSYAVNPCAATSSAGGQRMKLLHGKGVKGGGGVRGAVPALP